MSPQSYGFTPNYYPQVPTSTYPTYFPQQPTYTSPQPAIPNVQQANQSGPASPSVCGRVISNPDSIAPQEVPMDGSISVFPMQDNSAIFVKRWNADGTIKTIKFVPDGTVSDIASTSNISLEDISQELAEIRGDLAKVLKSRTVRTTKGDGNNA